MRIGENRKTSKSAGGASIHRPSMSGHELDEDSEQTYNH